MPNGSILNTNTQCKLANKHLSPEAASGFILPGIAKHSLVSVSKLCDNNCIETFNKQNIVITKNNKTIWQVE